MLYRFSPAIRTEFGRSEEGRWISRYGFEEHTIGKDDDDSVEDGRYSRRRRYRKVVREGPGLAPAALFHLIGNSVFLRLSDVASGLPSYEEQVLLSSMDREPDATGYSQRGAYGVLFEKLRAALTDAVAPDRREAWVEQKVKEGIDVLICHPRLVQTGLDLIAFPRGALQADALKLVAKKLQSSLAVEGELPEDGLAAYGDDGDDLMLALARKIVNGDEDEESVEAIFAQAMEAEASGEELLVGEGWDAMGVEPERGVVEVHRNGTGTAAVEEANGHHDGAPETQRLLFSWAEFKAEEPVEKQNRRGKKEAASLSLFEWALTLEQEREEEIVGAGALTNNPQGRPLSEDGGCPCLSICVGLFC